MAGLDAKRTAISVGLFAAVVHLVWVLLVALGLAKGLVEFKLGLHFLSVPGLAVGAFDLVTAVELLVVAFVVGALVGGLFALVWNWSSKLKL